MFLSRKDFTPNYENIMNTIHPDDRESVAKAVGAGLEKDKPVDIDYRIRRPDGTECIVNSRGKVFRDKKGNPIRVAGTCQDITERKKAEQELKKQQYYLEKAQELGKIGTWGLYLIQNKLVWTDENCRIFGVPEGTVVNYEIFLSIVHPDDREYVDQEWKAALERKPYDIEHRITVEGKTKWVREKADVEYDKHGKATSAIGFTQDITERKKAEENLRQSEEKFRTFMETASDLMLIADKDENITYLNESLASTLGYSKEEMLGMNITQFLTKEALEKDFKPRWEDFVTNRKISLETTFATKDGKEIYGELKAVAVYESDGKYIGSRAIFRDITERKKAEEALRLQSEIASNLNEGVYLIRLSDGEILWTNDVFDKMFGYEPGEIVGKEVSIVNAPAEKTPKETKEEIVDILVKTGKWQGEIQNMKKDGTPFWCYASVSLFDHPTYGKVIVSVHTDITEQRESERRIKEYQAQLKSLAS